MTVISDDLADLVVDVGRVGPMVAARLPGVVRNHGMLLLAEVRSRASKPRSGPPGPRLQTGDYVRSMNVRFGRDGLSATVSTNRPQARRLEYGFQGTDSRGRVFHQPPYPHFGPARDIVRPRLVAAVRAAVRKDL